MPSIRRPATTILDDVIDDRVQAILRRDLAEGPLSPDEARYLVDTYYIWQEMRKRQANEIRAMGEHEPTRLIAWLLTHAEKTENLIRLELKKYCEASVIGVWAMSILGIGPVLTAGLLAHIDIHKAPTVGHIYSFGGWNPTVKWEKGKKRPWNAALKRLLYLIGDSFVKTKNNPESLYGPIYDEAKARYERMNTAGEFVEAARETLVAFPTHKQAKLYKKGLLPPGRIDLRARRVAVKLFLSHLHEVMYWCEFKKLAPAPYPMEHLTGHTYIPVPHRDLVPGMPERKIPGPPQPSLKRDRVSRAPQPTAGRDRSVRAEPTLLRTRQTGAQPIPVRVRPLRAQPRVARVRRQRA